MVEKEVARPVSTMAASIRTNFGGLPDSVAQSFFFPRQKIQNFRSSCSQSGGYYYFDLGKFLLDIYSCSLPALANGIKQFLVIWQTFSDDT